MINHTGVHNIADPKQIEETLFRQLMSVMGLKRPSWITRCLYPLFAIPTKRMTGLLVELDNDIAQKGGLAAISLFLKNFIADVMLTGAESIPGDGPLMVICNHPAAYDLVLLATYMQREDLKIIASDIPLIQKLPNISEHMIPVPYNIPYRLETVRRTIRHLKNGGSILIFPRGNIEPDPAVSPGAVESMSGWSESLELFLRQVPQTVTVVAIASGVLSPGWYKNPLVNLWKKYEQRQKVAEVFQIATQLLRGKKPTAIPRLSFSSPLTVSDLGEQMAPAGALLASLTDHARKLLATHPNIYY